jgi:hypothetical protein
MTSQRLSTRGGRNLRDYLLPGEQIVWEGKPDVRTFMFRGWWYLVPFSLLWGGFAIFWEASAIAGGAPPFFLIWGIPFVLIGLYMIFGHFYVAAREAENTTYAITDRRVLILGGAFRSSLVELDLDRLPGVQLDEGRDGRGTITFSSMGGFTRVPPGWPTFGMYRTPPALQAISDVRGVFDKLQQVRTEARSTIAGVR